MNKIKVEPKHKIVERAELPGGNCTMNSINLEQLKLIQTKMLLGIPLSAFEKAYYTLYGDKLTEVN